MRSMGENGDWITNCIRDSLLLRNSYPRMNETYYSGNILAVDGHVSEEKDEEEKLLYFDRRAGKVGTKPN